MPPSSLQAKRRWLICELTPLCPDTYAAKSEEVGALLSLKPVSTGGLGRYCTSPCTLSLYDSLGKICLTVRCLKVEELVLRVSDRVVFSTSSASLRPCAMRTVEAMVSTRHGLSNQETLSEASVSPRSIRDALGALRDLEGLTLNVPLDDVAAWRNNWYWAAETFFRDPSSSSSSEIDLSLTLYSSVQSCRKVDWWSIPGARFWGGRPSNGRSRTHGISGFIHPSGTSDRRPGSSVWSPGTPGWSLWSSRRRMIMCSRRCVINGPGLAQSLPGYPGLPARHPLPSRHVLSPMGVPSRHLLNPVDVSSRHLLGSVGVLCRHRPGPDPVLSRQQLLSRTQSPARLLLTRDPLLTCSQLSRAPLPSLPGPSHLPSRPKLPSLPGPSHLLSRPCVLV